MRNPEKKMGKTDDDDGDEKGAYSSNALSAGESKGGDDADDLLVCPSVFLKDQVRLCDSVIDRRRVSRDASRKPARERVYRERER